MRWPRGWLHHDFRSGSPTIRPMRLGSAGSESNNSPMRSSSARAWRTAARASSTAPAYSHAMIIGAHSIISAEDAERTRAFIREVLGFPYVDAHGGWLIFRLPPGELGIHPIEPAASGRHELYLMCDNIDQTVQEL